MTDYTMTHYSNSPNEFKLQADEEGSIEYRGRLTGPNEVVIKTQAEEPTRPMKHSEPLLDPMEVGGDGVVRTMRPMTHKATTESADRGLLLGTITDNAGRPCYDQRAAVANPDNYRITIGGTQAALSTALRLGLVGISGSGQLVENVQNVMAAINPKDRSLPGADSPKPSHFVKPSAVVSEFNGRLAGHGIDGNALLAQAAIDPDRAANQLAPLLGIQDPEEVADVVKGVLQVAIEDVGAALQKAGVENGPKAFASILERMTPATMQRLFVGALHGHVGTLRELKLLSSNRDRY